MDSQHLIIRLPRFGLRPDLHGKERILPESCRPTYIHDSRESAEVECLRLARRFPDHTFLIFTADTITHTTQAEVGGPFVTVTRLDPFPPPPPDAIPARPKRRRQSAIRNPQSAL